MTQLSNATNPESGTVNYGYSNGLLSWKTDAKGGKVEYSYDSYSRVSQIRHSPAEYPFSGVGEDTCQRVDFTYDSNPDSGFTYLAGQLATRTYSVCVQPNGGGGASALRRRSLSRTGIRKAGSRRGSGCECRGC